MILRSVFLITVFMLPMAALSQNLANSETERDRIDIIVPKNDDTEALRSSWLQKELEYGILMKYAPESGLPEMAGMGLHNVSGSGFIHAIGNTPGYGFLSSLAVPGLSQAAQGQYWKTGLMIAVEAAAIYLMIESNNRGHRLESRYIATGDANWSVVQYAQWVHTYYHTVPGARSPGSPDFAIQSLLTPAGQQAAAAQGRDFPLPAFDTSLDWSWINLPALRQLERSALYLATGRAFSHDVPDFGSQQYYELMSKYWQFGPGWRDWGTFTNNDFNAQVNALNALRNSAMSPMWQDHARLEERFNDSFRMAGNMVMLLVANHVFSAFDAYFTIKLRNHRLESTMSANQFGPAYQLTWHF